jgi:hypothetical protein
MQVVSYNSIGHDMFDLVPHISLLRQGNNVLSAEVHQSSSDSEDLLWDASLMYDVSTEPTVLLQIITPAGGTCLDGSSAGYARSGYRDPLVAPSRSNFVTGQPLLCSRRLTEMHG